MRRFPTSLVLILPILGTGIAAQRVTPLTLTTVSGALPYDFMSWRGPTARYQQIVTGLGLPMSVSQIAFRSAADHFTYIARTLDLELKIGASSFANRSVTFAGNLPVAVQAIARKNVNWPAHTTPPTGGYPAPFDCILAFDAPWNFLGQQDVCFEIVVHANSAYPNRLCVLDGNDEDVPYNAIGTQHGQGCTAAGRSKPLSCYAYFGVRGVGPRHTFSWAGFEAPTSTPGLLCLGLTQLTLALPELCAPLQLFPIDVTLPIASAGDGWSVPQINLPYDPSFVGKRIHAQAVFPDPGQTSIVKAALSSGVSSAAPGLGSLPMPAADVAFVYTDQLAANAGSLESWKGLVVEWK
jgi:hypothetical protein